MNKKNKLESLSTRIHVLAACPRIPLDNHYPIAYGDNGRRQWENGFIAGCEVCAMK